jgi:hypothetical protein
VVAASNPPVILGADGGGVEQLVEKRLEFAFKNVIRHTHVRAYLRFVLHLIPRRFAHFLSSLWQKCGLNLDPPRNPAMPTLDITLTLGSLAEERNWRKNV